ncbi:hypothetical protein GGR57DRAFT_506578 [Xylariaceae sp. FL1272]|nr:hypothetical protein GGR57DRAFT_506578 [Xylariaceae sp. FL1272]
MQRLANFMLGRQQQPSRPAPTPTTITGIRFPAHGGGAHLVSLTTTTDDLENGVYAVWGHVPDLRLFWETARAWQWRDVETFRLENQPISSCDGLYALFYSFDLESLPENRHFPEAVFGRERAFAGDAFVVKLKSDDAGYCAGDDGWAVWESVPSDILSLPVLAMQ